MNTLELVGSLLAIIMAVLGPIFGFLFKRLLDNLEKSVERLEEDMRENEKLCTIRHDKMPSTFVPRTEIAEITRGLRDSMEKQGRQIESLHVKLDKILTIVKNGH